MIISAKIIKHPRKQRKCNSCHRPIVGETLRLYGMAEIGYKPYEVYLHPTCDKSKEVARKLASGTTTRAADLAYCTCLHVYVGAIPKYCPKCNKPVSPNR